MRSHSIEVKHDENTTIDLSFPPLNASIEGTMASKYEGYRVKEIICESPQGTEEMKFYKKLSVQDGQYRIESLPAGEVTLELYKPNDKITYTFHTITKAGEVTHLDIVE